MRLSTFVARCRLLVPALLLLALAGRAPAQDFLEPEQAFRVSARALDDRSVELTFVVAPGYYLYREQFKFVAEGATFTPPQLPAGKVKFDQTFAKDVETYRDVVRVPIAVAEAPPAFRLIVTSQGCADAGLCYPPMQSGFSVSLAGFAGTGMVRALTAAEVGSSAVGVPGSSVGFSSAGAAGAWSPAAAATPPAGPVSAGSGADSTLGSALRQGSFWPVVGAFFAAGVLLSLTPCVLPMLPIVSSIIVGHGALVSRRRGMALAAAYSFGMAIVYTALGVAAGLAGEGLAAALQKPLVLSLFALGLVVLALSMFGVYELRLPAALTSRMLQASNRLPAGRMAGVCAMGGVSALIVSPCVAAPLAGALVYLSQTRDVWLGGTALFSLAAGMSLPLLLVGASAGSLLPRAGAWMVEVKRFFGVLLLGVALWTVQTVLPPSLVLALWGVLAVAVTFLLIGGARGAAPASAGKLWRQAVATVFGLCALLQFVGAASGGTDPLQPLRGLSAGLRGEAASTGMPSFQIVRTVAELERELQSASRPVMLDFYADWCVSCKEMERFTFSDPRVREKLNGALLLKADVTRNNPDDRALLKRFGLFGPPGTIFFHADGREVADARVIGFQNAGRFVETLQRVGL